VVNFCRLRGMERLEQSGDQGLKSAHANQSSGSFRHTLLS
jgi:hypothetical protein